MFNGSQKIPGSAPQWNSLFTGSQDDQDDSGYQQYQSHQTPSVSITDIIDALVASRDAQVAAEEKLESIISAEKAPIVVPIDAGKSQVLFLVAHKLFANNDVWSPDSTLFQSETGAQYELRRLSMKSPTIEYEIKRVQWLDPLMGDKGAKGTTKIPDDSDDDTDSEFDNDFTKRYNL